MIVNTYLKSDGAPFCWACGYEMDNGFDGIWVCLECNVVLKDDDPGVIILKEGKENG